MSLERSPTLRSSEEENGLRRALEIVKKQGDFYKRQQGLSPFSFALGLFNVGFTGFCLGRFVEYYWVWQVLKSLVLNYLSYSIKLKNHQRLYLMDLCHWLSFAYSIVGTISLAAWAIPGWKEWLAPVTSSPYVFRACFCLANGPLGWAVPALANALILHSVEHTAALFIHISPPMVTWALRWHPEEHETAFPGILPMPGLDDTTNGSGVGYVELITPRRHGVRGVVGSSRSLARVAREMARALQPVEVQPRYRFSHDDALHPAARAVDRVRQR